MAPGAPVDERSILSVGIGCTSGVMPTAMVEAVASVLHAAGLLETSIARVGTVDRRADHPAVVALGRALGAPVVGYPPTVLEGRTVPNPSDLVGGLAGTTSVAEAAALLAAGPDGRLVLEKQVVGCVTVAVAARRPEGQRNGIVS